LRFLPGVEAVDDIDHVAAGPLQETARDHAAIATSAVHCDGRVLLDLGQRGLKAIQRIPVRAVDVSGFPFAFSANIEHLYAALVQARVQFLTRDLWHLLQSEACLLPSSGSAFKKTCQVFNPDPSQAKT